MPNPSFNVASASKNFPVMSSLPAVPVPVSAVAPVPVPVRSEPTKSKTQTNKAKSSFFERYAEARDGNQYMKANGDDRFLKLTGAKMQLSKNPDTVYYGSLRLWGTPQEIETIANDAENADFIQLVMDTLGQADEIFAVEWQVSLGSFPQQLKDTNSWVFKEYNDVKEQQKDENIEAINKRVVKQYNSLKSSNTKIIDKNDPVSSYRHRLDELKDTNNVLDVSRFDAVKHTGTKTMRTPTLTGRSQRSCITLEPICSNNAESMKVFLRFMGYSAEAVAEGMREWVLPSQ